jgi:spore maturation protein CgeB
MAMRLVPVLNRLPGLDYMGFEDGRHYLGFSSMDEAVEKVQWALANREFAQQIADQAYQFVNTRNMTWESRVDTILKTCGLV